MEKQKIYFLTLVMARQYIHSLRIIKNLLNSIYAQSWGVGGCILPRGPSRNGINISTFNPSAEAYLREVGKVGIPFPRVKKQN